MELDDRYNMILAFRGAYSLVEETVASIPGKKSGRE